MTASPETNLSECLASDDKAESFLLSHGIVSLDGLEGMDYERACQVAKYSAEIASRQYRIAVEGGLL